jgi:hypothetical protein
MAKSKYNIVYKILAIALIPFLIWMGFIREETFVEMNKLIMFKQHPEVGNGAGEIVAEYFNYTETELFKAKWFLTVQFSVYFFLLSSAILILFYRKKEPTLYLLFFYIGLFLLAGISYGSGYITGNQGGAYLVARRLMGLLQSPYPFMLIFVIQLFGLDKMKIKGQN